MIDDDEGGVEPFSPGRGMSSREQNLWQDPLMRASDEAQTVPTSPPDGFVVLAFDTLWSAHV